MRMQDDVGDIVFQELLSQNRAGTPQGHKLLDKEAGMWDEGQRREHNGPSWLQHMSHCHKVHLHPHKDIALMLVQHKS